MKRCISLCSMIFIAMLIAALPSFAYLGNSTPTYISGSSNSDYNYSDYFVAGTPSGEIITARHTAGANGPIYVDKYNAAGTTSLWGGEKLVGYIGNNNKLNGDIRFAGDHNGGAVIAHANDSNQVYFSHIGSDGNLIKTDTAIAADLADYQNCNPSIACDKDGYSYIVWESRYRQYSWQVYTYNISCMKINPDGTNAWTAPAAEEVDSTYWQYTDPSICEDDKGGAYIAYNSTGNIRVYKVDSNGTFSWENYSNPYYHIQDDGADIFSDPAICPNGISGAIVAWTDTSDTLRAFNVGAQRTNAWGSWKYVSEPNDCSAYYSRPSLAPDGTGGAHIAWTNANSDKVEVQRIQGDGNIHPSFSILTNFGNIYGHNNNPIIAKDINGGAVIGWVDWNNNPNRFYKAKIIDTLPGTIYVSKAGSNIDYNGTSPTYSYAHPVLNGPFPTIQKGLMNVATGGTVYVANATYEESNITWPPRNNVSLKVYSGTPQIYGDKANRIIHVPYAVNLTIEGFYLKYGRTYNSSIFPNGGLGGGIYLTPGSSLTLRNTAMNYCTAETSGGAVYSYGANLYVTGVDMINCRADSGGAIYASTSICTIENSGFYQNIASNYGGAILSSNLLMKNSMLVNNVAGLSGGAVMLGPGKSKIINCTFGSNTSSNGSSINLASSIGWFTAPSWLTLKNSIVFNEDRSLPPITLSNNSSLEISYSELSSTSGLVSSVANAITVSPLTGVLTLEPHFTSSKESSAASERFMANSNHTLEAGSPCIDSGTMDATVPTTDIFGATRPRNYADMGAAEFQGPHVLLKSQQNGEQYRIGDPITITWEASESAVGRVLDGTVEISYSINNGTSWTLIPPTGLFPNSAGNIVWTAPMTPSNLCRIKVKATSTSPTQVNSSYSNLPFYILAKTIYVSTNTGNDSYSGTSPSTPYKTLQKGLDSASDYGTVIAMPGIYKGPGNVNLIWPNYQYVTLKGAGTIETVISSESNNDTRGMSIVFAQTASIESLTIRDGYMWLPATVHKGAGIYITDNNANVTLNNVALLNNRCEGASYVDCGAAVFAKPTATVRAYGSSFKNNRSSYLGGAINGGKWVIENSVFENNFSNDCGGAMASIESAVIRNTIFKSNKCNGTDSNLLGGVIYNLGKTGTITIESSRFIGNVAGYSGGALYGGNYDIFNSSLMGNRSLNWYGATISYANANVHNSVFWANGRPETRDYSVFMGNTGTGRLTAESCIFFSNYPNCIGGENNISWSDLQSDSITLGSGIGNISADPRFISTSETNANFMRPKSTSPASPCIDTGTLDAVYMTDVVGTLRPQPINGRADMGIFEHVGTPHVHNISRGKDYFTIFGALRDAITGETITLDNGPYNECIISWPNIQDITIKPSAPGVSWDAIVVSAQGYGSVFNLTATDPSIRGTIEGITISNGTTIDAGGGISAPLNSNIMAIRCKITGNQALNGGGASNTKLMNCSVVNNIASTNGGGLYQGSASGCLFQSNQAGFGGGAYNSTITVCSFESNKANSTGGGLFGGTAYKTNFYVNTATSSGGAIADASLVDKCRIIRNTAPNGSAISMAQDSDSIVRNCLIVASTANPAFVKDQPQPVGVSKTALLINNTMYNTNIWSRNGKLEFMNCIVWGNPLITADAIVSATYSDIQGGFFGFGNIDEDPLFVSTSALNFRLGSDSLCINAGVLDVNTPADDILDTSRIGLPDLGAYEYAASNVFLITPNSSVTSIEAGYPYVINWNIIDQSGNTAEAERIVLTYQISGDVTWNSIADGALPSKTFTWNVPTSEFSGCNIKIDLTTSGGLLISTQTSPTFEVSDTIPPTFTLKTGIPKFMGIGYILSWEATDIFPLASNCVRLEFSPDFGVNWSELSSGLAKDATFTFNPDPGTSSPESSCSIRFTVTDPNSNYTILTSDSFGIDTKAPTTEITMPISYESLQVNNVNIVGYDENGVSVIRIKAGETADWVPYYFSGSSTYSSLSTSILLSPPLAGLHTVTFEASDIGGNITTETRTIEVILSPTPEIRSVFIEDYPILDKEHEVKSLPYIAINPKITSTIKFNYGDLDKVIITIFVNGVPYTFEANSVVTPDDVSLVIATAETSLPVNSGSVKLMIEAVPLSGNVATYESYTMTLSSTAKVTQKAKTIPNPFSPSKGGTFTFIYKLSNNADIKLMIFDLSGRPVWQRNFYPGSNGGRGPYDDNVIIWDGKSDFGNVLPNGVYIFMITSDSKVISKGQLTIID